MHHRSILWPLGYPSSSLGGCYAMKLISASTPIALGVVATLLLVALAVGEARGDINMLKVFKTQTESDISSMKLDICWLVTRQGGRCASGSE